MHGFANPKRFLALANPLTPLLLVGGLVVSAAALYWGLFQVPPDRLMGETVRILFLHVPAAWLGMGGWAAIAVASLVFLVWRHPLAALAARARDAVAAAPPAARGRTSKLREDRLGGEAQGRRGSRHGTTHDARTQH